MAPQALMSSQGWNLRKLKFGCWIFWPFFGLFPSSPPKSKNDALVCFNSVSKPGAHGPCSLSINHTVPGGPELRTVTLQAHESQIPSWVNAETHSSCPFSGFKAALLALLFLLFSVLQERWVALQIGNRIFLSLAWRCFLDQPFRLVVGSVEVVGFSSFCVT